MRRLFILLGLALTALVAGGCGFVFAARGPAYAPAYSPGYCSDCHNPGRWHRAYNRCEYYSIRVVHNGYYYRPYKHAKHVEYVFRSHDFSYDKQVREKESKQEHKKSDDKQNREKDKRSRR